MHINNHLPVNDGDGAALYFLFVYALGIFFSVIVPVYVILKIYFSLKLNYHRRLLKIDKPSTIFQKID